MEADEAIADSPDGSSEPLGFADVRVRAMAERARIEQEAWRGRANARTRPGRIRLDDRPATLLFRPPYWMVVGDTGE